MMGFQILVEDGLRSGLVFRDLQSSSQDTTSSHHSAVPSDAGSTQDTPPLKKTNGKGCRAASNIPSLYSLLEEVKGNNSLAHSTAIVRASSSVYSTSPRALSNEARMEDEERPSSSPFAAQRGSGMTNAMSSQTGEEMLRYPAWCTNIQARESTPATSFPGAKQRIDEGGGAYHHLLAKLKNASECCRRFSSPPPSPWFRWRDSSVVTTPASSISTLA
jgi:hypothetical protein